jgi:hypothetical protein
VIAVVGELWSTIFRSMRYPEGDEKIYTWGHARATPRLQCAPPRRRDDPSLHSDPSGGPQRAGSGDSPNPPPPDEEQQLAVSLFMEPAPTEPKMWPGKISMGTLYVGRMTLYNGDRPVGHFTASPRTGRSPRPQFFSRRVGSRLHPVWTYPCPLVWSCSSTAKRTESVCPAARRLRGLHSGSGSGGVLDPNDVPIAECGQRIT